MKKTVTKALLKGNYIEIETASINITDCGNFVAVKIYGQAQVVNKKELRKLIKHRKLAIVAI